MSQTKRDYDDSGLSARDADELAERDAWQVQVAVTNALISQGFPGLKSYAGLPPAPWDRLRVVATPNLDRLHRALVDPMDKEAA